MHYVRKIMYIPANIDWYRVSIGFAAVLTFCVGFAYAVVQIVK